MESLEAKKVRLLGRWLSNAEGFPDASPDYLKAATSILTLLDEIEQAHWTKLEELNELTHVGEVYSD